MLDEKGLKLRSFMCATITHARMQIVRIKNLPGQGTNTYRTFHDNISISSSEITTKLPTKL